MVNENGDGLREGKKNDLTSLSNLTKPKENIRKV